MDKFDIIRSFVDIVAIVSVTVGIAFNGLNIESGILIILLAIFIRIGNIRK